MNKEQTLELLIKAIPYPNQIDEIDFSSEENAIRFIWRGTKFRVSTTYHVEECSDGVLCGSDKAILLSGLLKKTRIIAGV